MGHCIDEKAVDTPKVEVESESINKKYNKIKEIRNYYINKYSELENMPKTDQFDKVNLISKVVFSNKSEIKLSRVKKDDAEISANLIRFLADQYMKKIQKYTLELIAMEDMMNEK